MATKWRWCLIQALGAWWGCGGISQMDGLCSCPSETHPIDACTRLRRKALFLGKCFWIVCTLSHKSFQFASCSPHDLLCMQVAWPPKRQATTSNRSLCSLVPPPCGSPFSSNRYLVSKGKIHISYGFWIFQWRWNLDEFFLIIEVDTSVPSEFTC